MFLCYCQRKYLVNKGNSRIPLFETHKSIERKNKSGLQTKTEGNALNIRGEQRHNRNTTLKRNTHINEQTNYNNGHFPDLVKDILRKK